MTETQLRSAAGTDGLDAFTDAVRTALLAGKRLAVPAFGTFTRCTRKAKGDRPACRIAMWRANAGLRTQLEGGAPVQLEGRHQHVVAALIQGMDTEAGVQVPGLGRFAVLRSGQKTKLIFHAAAELNDALSAAL